MDILSQIIAAALISIFIQNSIFDRALGANVALYASRKKENLRGFSLGIILITTLSSFISFFFDRWLAGYEYKYIFMPLIYVLIISIIYIASLMIMWFFMPKIFKLIKKYVHLSVFNCSVIGALFLNSSYGDSVWSYIGYGFGTGVGFLLAGFLLNAAQERMASPKVPKAFRGYPIMMVYIGILALAFYTLVGYKSTI